MVRLVILRISESYFRHRWLYLLPIVLMWGIAAVSISIAPLYLARGVMYVEQESVLSSLISVRDTNISWETPADQTSLEIGELLQTDAFIRAVIHGTNLEEHMDEGSTIVDQIMDEVRENVWADAPGNNQVRVAATHNDPEIAYQLVDATIENYTLWKINANRAEIVSAHEFFSDLLDQYDSELEIARRDLKNYLATHPEPARGNRPDIEVLDLSRLQSDLESADSRYADTLTLKDNAELALSQAESSVRQTYFYIDAPRVPEEPATTLMDTAVKIIIFTVVGVILSAIGILGGMLLDRSFRFPLDVQHSIDLPVIAAVPEAE